MTKNSFTLQDDRAGPKKSRIVKMKLTKYQKNKMLKAAMLTSFTGEELEYQRLGIEYRKPRKKARLEDILIGAFVLKALKEKIERE